ncbi:hypothetical protein KMI_03g04830 [Encephalitozoon hellem]|nr:hypothetical protein KMI_03g04830 [Encephalitozoon hellem]
MNPGRFSALGVCLICTIAGTSVSQELVVGTEVDMPSEAAVMDLEKVVLKLDRLIWKLLKVGKSRSENRKNGMEAHAGRMFGVPIKTEKQWKKLAEKIRRKERERDMKHWKQHLIHNGTWHQY